MPEGHDTTIEVSNIMSFVLYTQIVKQSVLKPASPGITLKFIEIVILWVYYTIPIGFNLFWQFFGITSHILNYFVWLRITGEGSLSEMRIWSISNLIRLKMVYTS